MTNRERFHAVMNFQPFDRLPVMEWAPWWNQTVERWHGEGLPATLTEPVEIARFFGIDLYKQWRAWPLGKGCPQPKSHGSGIIESMDDYMRIRPHLFPTDALADPDWDRWIAAQQAGDLVIWLTVDGFFWFPRTLLGIERHLFAFYDQPDLMHQINQDLVDWQLTVLDTVLKRTTPDFMTFAEDMSYNNGPMLSEALFDEFLLPYYRQVVPRFKEAGIWVIVDSDGDITTPAHWFERAGIDGILPLERQAGVDIVRLRREHPRMRFIGHYDKMVMTKGEAAMRSEFERLWPTAAKGGFLISCDHQTPPGVSIDEYRLYVRLFHEYAHRAAA